MWPVSIRKFNDVMIKFICQHCLPTLFVGESPGTEVNGIAVNVV